MASVKKIKNKGKKPRPRRQEREREREEIIKLEQTRSEPRDKTFLTSKLKSRVIYCDYIIVIAVPSPEREKDLDDSSVR